MDYCFVVPDPLGTARQPQTRQFTFPPPHRFDSRNESASHNSISAQQTINSLDSPHTLSLSYNDLVLVPQDTQIPSVSDAELTATATGPTPKRRKKKAPTLRAKDWERYKARILELHDTQNLPLPKVKEMIEEEFGFVAELRQYRTRITKWGKDKNIKKPEMAAIVRKRQQRKLIEIDKREQIFSVRGKNVEPQNIDRWMTRNGVSQTSLYAPSPAASTPSAVVCRTNSERGSTAPSPAYSTRSLDFSPRGAISITSSPTTPSPVTIMPGMGYPQNTGFNIQRHAHTYEPVSTIPLVRQSPPSDVVPLEQPPRRYKQAEEEAIKGALSIAESSFGAYHSQTLELRVKLGCILYAQGRYKHAEEIARKTVEDCENNENALIIKFDALQLLSKIIYQQGSSHQSRKLQEWLFEWGKVNLGKEHPSVVGGMIELSWNYIVWGNVKEGEELCAQALNISKEAFGESHHETINATAALVYAYTMQGRLDDAERLWLQLLTKAMAAMAVLGNRHICTIIWGFRLRFAHHRQGRSNEAAEVLRQVLEMSVHSLGEDHPMTISGRQNLSLEYKSQGRLEEAQDLGEQAFRAAQRVLGRQNPAMIEHMVLLVEIYKDQGQITKAEELEQQRQELERRVLERQEEDVGLDFSFMTKSLGSSSQT